MAKTKLKKIKCVLRNIFFPHIRLRFKDVKGMDGISRKQYYVLGILWEFHTPGYYEVWYDGPICHISLGLVSVYWHFEYLPLK